MVSRNTDPFAEFDDAPETDQQKKVRKARLDREYIAFRDVLATYEGREYLWRLLERCGVWAPSFRVGEPDTTSFNEGARNIGLSIYRDILGQADGAEVLAAMQKEARARDESFKKEMEDGAV